jgi:hypothetical protein
MLRLLLSLLVLFVSSLSFADTVTLKSGKVIEGTIVDRSDDFIKIYSGSGELITYSVGEIKDISASISSPESDQKNQTSKDNLTTQEVPQEGFVALHFSHGVSLGNFTEHGPDNNSLQPIKGDLQQITYDPVNDEYYGITRHDFGRLDKSDYRFAKIELDKSVIDLSWPKGITMDTKRRRVIFTGGSGAGQDIFAFKVDSKEWEILSEDRHSGEEAITYCESDDSLYATKPEHGIKELLKINSKGAIIETIPLSESIPFFGGTHGILQMNCYEGDLYVLLKQKPHPRLNSPVIYKINPLNGDMAMMAYNQKENLVEKLWPGMPDGPQPESFTQSVCGRGALSHYRTPTELLKEQDRQLHVISVLHGDMNMWEELKRIKKFKVDSEGIQISIDLSERTTAVTVFVEKSEKPLVLALLAPVQPFMPNSIIWTLDFEEDANIDKVIINVSEHQRIVGLPKDVKIKRYNFKKISRDWELLENKSGEFDSMIEDIRNIAGLREASFQGCSYGKSFYVP